MNANKPSLVPTWSRGHKRYRDTGALYSHTGELHSHLRHTDLVRFRVFEDGDELWYWVDLDKEVPLAVGGQPFGDAMRLAEGELVLVYEPTCPKCSENLQGCHYCHDPYDASSCPICGKGLSPTDPRGWKHTRHGHGPSRIGGGVHYSNPEDVEADLDNVAFGELGEHGELPYAVAKALIKWRDESWGLERHDHRVASFLDMMADLGYAVVKIEAPELDDLLPAPEGS